jgi:hypothetical protein
VEFDHTARAKELQARLRAFMAAHIYFLPESEYGAKPKAESRRPKAESR